MHRTFNLLVTLCGTILLCGGCTFPAFPEYNYRGTPQGVEVNAALAMDFAAGLAKEADLRIVGQTKATGNKNLDATFIVSLKPQGSERISVTVMANIPKRIIYVTVSGDIKSPRAIAITRVIEDLYPRKYPGSSLTAYTRRQGLLGP